MTLRSRLLLWLLPALIGFVMLIASFFTLNWYRDISASFRENLRSIVVSLAASVSADDIVWMTERTKDPLLTESALYQHYHRMLSELEGKLPISSLSIILIEPSPEPGEKHRQLVLVDAEASTITYDFSESNEHKLYKTKQPLVTEIYQGKGTEERYLTAFAPVLNQENKVVALVTADLNLKLFTLKVKRAFGLVLASTLFTVLLVISVVIWSAHWMSRTVEKLKNAALTMAGGHYDEPIPAVGPRELADLASTLNTMRECLLEQMAKYQGDQTTAIDATLFLQKHVLENAREHGWQIIHGRGKSIRGLLVEEIEGKWRFSEAVETGFGGIYRLLRGVVGGYLHLKEPLAIKNFPPPFWWPQEKGGKFLVIGNSGLMKLFDDSAAYEKWLDKVFRHFAGEGWELMSAMLTSEISSLLKKRPAEEDVYLLIKPLAEESNR